MSVNDSLPWIESVCALIRDAVARDIPVIGHCLGGQLISKALDGTITRSPFKEIGWGTVNAEDNDVARHWIADSLSKTGAATVFQWHGETFSLPSGAQRILSNGYCANQAFALGPHLAMQCHVEMTPEMIAEWCNSWSAETQNLAPLPESVQTPGQMQAEIGSRLPAMRILAERLYSVWVRGLRGD